MFSSPLFIFFISMIALFSAMQNVFFKQHAPTTSVENLFADGNLMDAYKRLQKDGSSSDFYEKTFVPLLTQYKFDIIAHHANDEKKLSEMVQVFLLSLNSCDETLPTILAETLSYRIDLFPNVMKHVPDKQKSEFLHMMQIGLANIEFEATKPGTPKADAERVRKFKTEFSEYQKSYP